MYDTDRIYLHGVNKPAGTLKTKHFQIVKQGTMKNGTRLRQIESSHPAVSPNFKFGIMVEPARGPSYIAYGRRDVINSIAGSLEKAPEKVFNRLRVATPSSSNQYYINEPAPEKMTVEMSRQEMERASTAHKLFPRQGEENRPYDRQQEERRAAKQHVREVAESMVQYPSSSDGKAQVDAAMKKATQATKPTSIVGSD